MISVSSMHSVQPKLRSHMLDRVHSTRILSKNKVKGLCCPQLVSVSITNLLQLTEL